MVCVALVIGFRATSGPFEWIAAAGLIALTALALTWVSVALALLSKSVETASNLPPPLMLLPFFGSGIVPTASMPEPLRWFADNQPFTPIIETVRRLLLGGDVAVPGLIAVGWCIAVTLVGHLGATRLYGRDRAR